MASTHEGHTSETQVPPGAEPDTGTFPPFDSANFVPVLIWLALSFGLLYILMSKIALPRVHDILVARQAKINEDLKNANKMRAEANAAAAAHGQDAGRGACQSARPGAGKIRLASLPRNRCQAPRAGERAQRQARRGLKRRSPT